MKSPLKRMGAYILTSRKLAGVCYLYNYQFPNFESWFMNIVVLAPSSSMGTPSYSISRPSKSCSVSTSSYSILPFVDNNELPPITPFVIDSKMDSAKSRLKN